MYFVCVFSCLSALLPVAESHRVQGLRDLQKALEDEQIKLLFEVSMTSEIWILCATQGVGA